MINYYRMMKNHYEAVWTWIKSYNKSKHKTQNSQVSEII